MAGERAKGHQVGGGARIDEDTSFYTEELCQLPLEFLAFLSKGQPKIEHASNAGLNLIFGENTAGVRNDRFTRHKFYQIFVTGALSLMNLFRVLAGQPKNFCFELFRRFHLVAQSNPRAAASRWKCSIWVRVSANGSFLP